MINCFPTGFGNKSGFVEALVWCSEYKKSRRRLVDPYRRSVYGLWAKRAILNQMKKRVQTFFPPCLKNKGKHDTTCRTKGPFAKAVLVGSFARTRCITKHLFKNLTREKIAVLCTIKSCTIAKPCEKHSEIVRMSK